MNIIRFYLLLMLLLGACLAAPTDKAARPSPEPQASDEAEQLDRLKEEKEAESHPAASEMPSTLRHSSEEEIDGVRREEKREPNREFYRKYAGVAYTPADLADYIARTGDEESVALAVEELLREGIFTRAQAISYLQDVKNARDVLHRDRKNQAAAGSGQEIEDKPVGRSGREINTTRQTERRRNDRREEDGDVEVERVLEKMSDTASDGEEYALEEMVFRLSKDMFARSLLTGDPTAEESLAKIAAFLETHTSVDTERRILDLVSAALIDTLKEFPDAHPFSYGQAQPGVDTGLPPKLGKGRDWSGRKPPKEEGSTAPSPRQ